MIIIILLFACMAGDFNLTCFNWLENNTNPNCQCVNLHEQLLAVQYDNTLVPEAFFYSLLANFATQIAFFIYLFFFIGTKR